MTKRAATRRIVIGIGNPERGDDAAGRLVARRLAGRLPADVTVAEHDGEPAGLIALMDGAAEAWLVDACRSGAAPGTLHRFDAAAGPLPARGFALSSHGLGLAEALELARALGRLPPKCTVIAIEGAAFEPGEPPSAAVAEAVAALAEEMHEGLAAKAPQES